jgi:hypothetical protein
MAGTAQLVVCNVGRIGSTRRELDTCIRTSPEPRMIATKATILTGWIHALLLPHGEPLNVARPVMLRATAAAKRKSDRIDAGKIADFLRCDFPDICGL